MGKVCGSQRNQLIEAMEMCKSGISKKKLLVRRAPEPMCVLATDRQLNKMVQNCTVMLPFRLIPLLS